MGNKKANTFRHVRTLLTAFILATVALHSVLTPFSAAASPSCDPNGSLCAVDTLLSLGNSMQQIAAPSIANPAWLKPHVTFTYSIATKGTITTDVKAFKQQVNQTLNDPRGWSRLNLTFNEVPSGGNLTYYLSNSADITSFSPSGCSNLWSCTVGNTVIINQDRWLSGTDSWNNAGGNLQDYRSMVINHETGHWLGHNHLHCSGPGQVAPVMSQQSIDLEGCKPNAWPLDSELWSTRL